MLRRVWQICLLPNPNLITIVTAIINFVFALARKQEQRLRNFIFLYESRYYWLSPREGLVHLVPLVTEILNFKDRYDA